MQKDAGSALVGRVDALTEVEAQRNEDTGRQSPATVAASVEANGEVLAIAKALAFDIDSDTVASLKEQVAQSRYLLDPTALVDQLMNDSRVLRSHITLNLRDAALLLPSEFPRIS